MTTARTTVASDATLVFAADLFASAIALRQATVEGRVGVSGVSNARTEVSGSVLGPMQLDGTAASALSLTITTQGSISFVRSTLAATQIEAVSARSIAFAFDPDRQAILRVGGDKSGGGEKRFYKKLSPEPMIGSIVT